VPTLMAAPPQHNATLDLAPPADRLGDLAAGQCRALASSLLSQSVHRYSRSIRRAVHIRTSDEDEGATIARN
jgi:hypothetical protein